MQEVRELRREEIVESDTEEDEILEEREAVPLRIRIPGARARGGPPAAAIPAPIDPGMWLSMVNVKPPHLADLEVESMKKFILDYKRYSQKCPRQLLRKIQQLILEEQLDVICDEDGRGFEEIVELEKEEFIQVMLRLLQANSSRKWRSMVKNAKMEKSDLSLNTYVQYVEDFKFWVLAAGNAHRLPEKEIVKMFVSGLKPEVFREEIYSRAFETLVDVMAET